MPFSFSWVLLCVMVKHKPLIVLQLWCFPSSMRKAHHVVGTAQSIFSVKLAPHFQLWQWLDDVGIFPAVTETSVYPTKSAQKPASLTEPVQV